MSFAAFPRVSVLVPLYNCEAFVEECLESVLKQTYSNIEVIVVNDGSSDHGPTIVEGFAARGVRLINQANRGQSAALNAAFGVSNGDFIQYLDADDLLHPRKIEVQVALLTGAESGMMASGAWARFADTIEKATFVREPVWRDLEPVEWLVESWDGGGMMHVAGWLIPRDVVVAAGPWGERYAGAPNAPNNDAPFFTGALLASRGCLFCGEARSYYRSTPGSMSARGGRLAAEAILAITIETGDALLKREDSTRTRRAFANNLQRYVFSVYPRHPDLTSRAEDMVAKLGGSSLTPSGGPWTRALGRFIGWKSAKRARALVEVLRSTRRQ